MWDSPECVRPWISDMRGFRIQKRLLVSCVPLGKSLSSSEPQFPLLYNGENETFVVGLVPREQPIRPPRVEDVSHFDSRISRASLADLRQGVSAF